MARTRAQEKASVAEPGQKMETTAQQPTSKKRTHSKTQKTDASHQIRGKKPKTKAGQTAASKAEEQAVSTSTSTKAQPSDARNARVQLLIEKYGSVPLEETELEDPSSPQAETILALVLNAMLSSARISHRLATKAVAHVIQAGYHKIDVLKKSSWAQRADLLTEGGYARYNEKTATEFGDLARLVQRKYDGDLNNLLKSTSESPTEIRRALKEIKGIGDVGADIFFDTAQGVWPCLAPFIDPRSSKTAAAIGIGSDVQVLWKEVGQDPMQMCKLASALTYVRLEKKEAEFK